MPENTPEEAENTVVTPEEELEEAEEEPESRPEGAGDASYHTYTAEEVIQLVVDALRAKAVVYEHEADQELMRRAAREWYMGQRRWGAEELRKFANTIENMPRGEYRSV